jgi:hypothetical protein
VAHQHAGVQNRAGEDGVIPAGKIGVVEAKDGKPLSGGRIIGRHVDCDSFRTRRRS